MSWLEPAMSRVQLGYSCFSPLLSHKRGARLTQLGILLPLLCPCNGLPSSGKSKSIFLGNTGQANNLLNQQAFSETQDEFCPRVWRWLTQFQGRDKNNHRLLTKTDLPAFPFPSSKEHWPVDATIIMHSLKPHHAIVKCPSLPICVSYCVVQPTSSVCWRACRPLQSQLLFSELSSRFRIFRNAASEFSSYFPRDFQLFSVLRDKTQVT